MRVTISGKDFRPTTADQQYVRDKLSKLGRFHRHIDRIGVELDADRNARSGNIFRIEVWVYLPGKTIEAGMKAQTMYAAVDQVFPVLERQLVKRKEKKLTLRRRASAE